MTAKKVVTKNKTKKQSVSVPAGKSGDYQSVDVRKADNGYVISTYGNKGKSKTFVAKDKPEMQGITKKLLGIK